jgi:hypothetical protein
VVAVDAGAMQIQSWEGAALSRAETLLQGTTHDTVRAEIGYGEFAAYKDEGNVVVLVDSLIFQQ